MTYSCLDGSFVFEKSKMHNIIEFLNMSTQLFFSIIIYAIYQMFWCTRNYSIFIILKKKYLFLLFP